MPFPAEHSACGVGFITNLENEASHENLRYGLMGLNRVEHRGGMAVDMLTSDGAGIMTDIPHALLGVKSGDAVANLFLPNDPTARVRALGIFEETFISSGLEVLRYRDVPVDDTVLSETNRSERPHMLMAIIARPGHCTTRYNFEKMLYRAKQLTRSRLRKAGIVRQFFFASLSAGTVVYKALTSSVDLGRFYLDLSNPEFKTRFCLFHRRFSTNTATTWDTAQPFRVVAHNGEINTISGNRAWAYARERALGLKEDQLLTHRGISDSGSVNEMIEALTFRSSIPHVEDILSILVPQPDKNNPFYRFWGRAMEPWDGPALIAFCEGRTIGARLDRSGFRPCRWARTKTQFFLSSEAGSFELPDDQVIQKGCLSGGGSVTIQMETGEVELRDTSLVRENAQASFDPRVKELPYREPAHSATIPDVARLSLFGFTEEDFKKMLKPMVQTGKEPIGSMGDSACLPTLSSEERSLYDHFYQRFAQVTNPAVDYLREKLVLDKRVLLGRKPNIFEPKELIPQKLAVGLSGPVLSLGQMDFIRELEGKGGFDGDWPVSRVFDATFDGTVDGFNAVLARIETEITTAIRNRVSIFILSDREASALRLPIPMALLVPKVIRHVNDIGMRLRTSLVVETGEVRNSHDLSVLVGFGAAAVCPYLLLQAACFHPDLVATLPTSAKEREKRVIEVLESGLTRIMAKMGVSVLRSYHGAELFSILGLSQDLHDVFFPGHASRMGGLNLSHIIRSINLRAEPREKLIHNYLLKEHPKGKEGEAHSISISRSKWIHKLQAWKTDHPAKSILSSPAYLEYQQILTQNEPLNIRQLLDVKTGRKPLLLDSVEPLSSILGTFGSGAMSFGAISAESQRDIFLAMAEVGARSNSGEGGENPYYFTDGIQASTKQVASGRFGVTAEYLVTGREIQIKIAQGAKPGEGGQLMAPKVSEEIARSRHSEANIDLISPPPMHDIYSIEDLKQLIVELRQLAPWAEVSVKLVSGENIGTIAVGVAKAGADIIQIAGHDGGTGAASVLSMKHTGLPWEIGLVEVHRALVDQNIRESVRLRVDGGLLSGRDVLMAALLGAEEYEFGKLLLIAEGCIMARVCEKNTCPTGIATQDPKFKRLYRGTKGRVIQVLELLAEEVRSGLAEFGVQSLKDLVGHTDWLFPSERHRDLIAQKGIDLNYFCQSATPVTNAQPNPYRPVVSELNEQILRAAREGHSELEFSVLSNNQAVPARLIGEKATSQSRERFDKTHVGEVQKPLSLRLSGSAGQGLGVFLMDGIDIFLAGEANDSVAKSMSGGKLVIVPPPTVRFDPSQASIVGNCALYGATGGKLFVYGRAGDRFGVRNSGATTVVEGVGMHACEYMTGGLVAILGDAGPNIGAGMTGGRLFIRKENVPHFNLEYVGWSLLGPDSEKVLHTLLKDYEKETGSRTARKVLQDWTSWKGTFVEVRPVGSTPEKTDLSDGQTKRAKAKLNEVRVNS